MAENSTRTSNKRLNSAASPYNALTFVIENMLKSKINTAIPVVVNSCTKPGTGGVAGYVSATPIIAQRGADGQSLPQAELPKLPFFRLQCGTAAIVADPQPGDIGLAVFAQSDCSAMKAGGTSPVQPGSFRSFDMADGFYLGGFLGTPPLTFVEIDPEGQKVNIKGPAGVTVESDSNITLKAPTIVLEGAVTIQGNGGGSTTANIVGVVNTSQNVNVGGISLNSHTHSGVQTGGSNTGGPNNGTHA